MFENKRERVITRQRFLRRVAWTVVLSMGIAGVALVIGITGFHYIADVPWIDALHNASMILGGMGPVAEMKTDAAKLFSSGYALFCGLVFVGLVAVMLAPIMHRVLHKFHIDETDLNKS
jgi:FtsH-binding integral membrane protein